MWHTFDLAVAQHWNQARALHLDERTHVVGDELALDHFLDLVLAARVEVVAHAIELLLATRFDLAHVVGAAVGGDELLRFDAVERGGGFEERALKVLLVHGAAVDAVRGGVEMLAMASRGRVIGGRRGGSDSHTQGRRASA